VNLSVVKGNGEGTVLDGRYELLSCLGSGASGRVYRALDRRLARQVAVKVLRGELLHRIGHEFLSAEAITTAQLSNEHTPRIVEVVARSDSAYIVMELLEGETLEARLEREGPLPVQQVVDIALQACVALAEAHGCGIVHRDIKPANLFMARAADGAEVLKVLDFGVASPPENTTGLLGTPLYVAPECLSGEIATHPQIDIWSLGAVLYELLVGRSPFDARTMAEIFHRIAHAEPPSLDALELPEPLQRAITRCLEKDPSKRYPHVVELAYDLEPLASRRRRYDPERAAHVLAASRRRRDLPEHQRARESVTRHRVAFARAAARTPKQRWSAWSSTVAAIAGTVVVAMTVPSMVDRAQASSAPRRAQVEHLAAVASTAIRAQQLVEPSTPPAEQPVAAPSATTAKATPRRPWVASRRAASDGDIYEPTTTVVLEDIYLDPRE
jgi:eukaryotic-like serine/threonine-protein kinase